MRPRGELNGTSQPIFFLSPREKRANIPPFVVQTHLPFLFQSFPPFSPFHMFNFTVSLLHFASPLLTTHHKAYLPSPLPQSASYIILPLFFPFLFFPLKVHRVASLPLLPSFPPTLQLFTQSWRLESPPLDLAPPLLSVPPVLSGLFAGPPSAALSGVSACEASALQYILLIGSILCIITPSCLWVQLAQSGPSV